MPQQRNNALLLAGLASSFGRGLNQGQGQGGQQFSPIIQLLLRDLLNQKSSERIESRLLRQQDLAIQAREKAAELAEQGRFTRESLLAAAKGDIGSRTAGTFIPGVEGSPFAASLVGDRLAGLAKDVGGGAQTPEGGVQQALFGGEAFKPRPITTKVTEDLPVTPTQASVSFPEVKKQLPLGPAQLQGDIASFAKSFPVEAEFQTNLPRQAPRGGTIRADVLRERLAGARPGVDIPTAILSRLPNETLESIAGGGPFNGGAVSPETRAQSNLIRLGRTGELTEDQVATAMQMRQQLSRQIQEFGVLQNAATRIRDATSDPSQAGDIGIVFGYMKILDPISVVREGEQATVQNAGNIPQRVRAMYNRLLTTDGRMEVTIRRDILKQAEAELARRHALLEQQLAPARQILQDQGIPVGFAIPEVLGTPEDIAAREMAKRGGGR